MCIYEELPPPLQYAISTNPKIKFAMPMTSLEIVLWGEKTALQNYGVHMFMYICEESHFQSTTYKLDIAIVNSYFLGHSDLSRVGKEFFICIYVLTLKPL